MITRLAAIIVTLWVFSGFCEASPDPSQLKDKVTVKLGDSLTVAFHAQGDRLTQPTTERATDEEKPGVSLEFKVDEGTRMLTMQNRFPRGLCFRCLARLQGRKEYVESSTQPLFPNFFSTQSFGDPVEELILFDFKLTDDKLPQ